MSQCSTAQSTFEPLYSIEVGGEMQRKSVPTFARAIALAEAYVNMGTTRKVEVFDYHRRRVYEGRRGLIARGP